MRFISTRGGAAPVTLSDAIVQGLASDGGLFVPERMPALPLSDFPRSATLPAIAEVLMAPFAEGDRLGKDLGGVCGEAFDFPAPLVRLERARGRPDVLELFHGPTCAFTSAGCSTIDTLAPLWTPVPDSSISRPIVVCREPMKRFDIVRRPSIPYQPECRPVTSIPAPVHQPEVQPNLLIWRNKLYCVGRVTASQ